MDIIFDTDCVFCAGWMKFVLHHERSQEIRFISAWSDEGLALTKAHGFSAQDLEETYLIILKGKALTKSDAGLAMMGQLKLPWRWAQYFRLIPRPLRDGVYDLAARNRYRWFGRRDQCFVPPQDQADRFVPGPVKSAALPDHW